MWISRPVAALAGRSESGGVGDRHAVTAVACQSLVGAAEREVRLAIVIEAPERPAIGVVARCTARSLGPFVDVAVGVAFHTVGRGSVKGGALMTILAGCGDV
jgi:hypothetical protein